MLSCSVFQHKIKSGAIYSAKFISWLYGKNQKYNYVKIINRVTHTSVRLVQVKQNE